MTDNEALQLMVQCNNNIFDSTLNIIADLDYTVISEDPFSPQFTKTAGGSYLGKSLLTMTLDDWRSEQYRKILTRCAKSKTNSKWLSLKFSRTRPYWLIIINFQPLINYSTDNVIRFRLSGEQIDLPLQLYSIKEIIRSSKFAKNNYQPQNDDFLTNREHEILFLLFYCDNYQQIADLMSLSHSINFTSSMVAKVVSRNLYVKFDEVNLDALKQAAHRKNYHKNVPPSLFGEFMYPLSML